MSVLLRFPGPCYDDRLCLILTFFPFSVALFLLMEPGTPKAQLFLWRMTGMLRFDSHQSPTTTALSAGRRCTLAPCCPFLIFVSVLPPRLPLLFDRSSLLFSSSAPGILTALPRSALQVGYSIVDPAERPFPPPLTPLSFRQGFFCFFSFTTLFFRLAQQAYLPLFFSDCFSWPRIFFAYRSFSTFLYPP